MLDNNVFIAAIKNPASNSRVLDLILECISNKEILLIGNSILIEEMNKYQIAFDSPTASSLLILLRQKTHIFIPKIETLNDYKQYFPSAEVKDMVHAATALDAKAIIITNDKHFEKIKESGKLVVWDIPTAIRAILSNNDAF